MDALVERFFTLLEAMLTALAGTREDTAAIRVAIEKLVANALPGDGGDDESPPPVGVIPSPPPMPVTTEKIIVREDFSTVKDIPDPTDVAPGTPYQWAAGNTNKATTTIQKIASFYAAIIAIFGVLREAQQGARAFFVRNGSWDALNAYFRKTVRLQIDFYLSDNWAAGSGAGYFMTIPIEVKRNSNESATVQTNIDERGIFWLGMPFGAKKMFFNTAMKPVHKGWNHMELRMELAPEETAKCELEYEGIVIKGQGAVSNPNGATAIALTVYGNSRPELSAPMTNFLLTEMTTKLVA